MPAGDRVRPTSDKVKQALFNILGTSIDGSSFLDLYAGTGGIGIEALSRGAARAVFVDDDRKSLQAVRVNIEQSGVGSRSTVIASKAESFIKRSEDLFDIVFLDPPYSQEVRPVLEQLAGSALLAPGAVVVAEHFKKQASPPRAGALSLVREAVYGDTVLAFYRIEGQGSGIEGQEGQP